MDKVEFLLIIPGVIYGIAVVDLLKSFSRDTDPMTWIWSSIVVIWMVGFAIELYDHISAITQPFVYLFIIVHAIIISKAIHTLTPEEKDVDRYLYWRQSSKDFFLLMSAIALMNICLHYFIGIEYKYGLRVFVVLGALASAFYTTPFIRYPFTAFVISILVLDLINIL